MLAATQHTFSSIVEEHLTALIEEATCIQRHTKRVRCTRSSSSSSSRATSTTTIHSESLPHGHHDNNIDNDEYELRNLLDAEDINLALKIRGCEKIYSPNVEGLLSVPDPKTKENTWTTKDASSGEKSCERVDLNAYIRSEMKSVP